VPIPFREHEFSLVRERANADGAAKGHPYLPLKLGVLWYVSRLPLINKFANLETLRTDKKVRPHPPVLRGLWTVVQALRDAGHNVYKST
jgi:hypothetical protein